jgi:hypothetical protein
VKPRLVDRTGRPGPATWRDGTFPPGEGDHPVGGVSWYEAAAYARFAGKSLPTVYHWVQAAQVEASVALGGSPYITRSNFGPRVRPVRSLTGPGVHGTLGMIGNVKEWCWNEADGGGRFILGGACGDPIYIPLTLESRSPLRRDEFFGFRCVTFPGGAKGEAAAWDRVGSVAWPAPPKREELMDAETFRLVILDRFTYDRGAPLDVISEEANEGEWVHVTARINAAYRDPQGRWERMTVHLYLPKGVDARKGYQTIVYLPGGDAQMLPRIRPLAEEYGLDALVRSGRAVLRPVYHGMYERRHPAAEADGKTWEDRRVCLGLDLMRAVDYLARRRQHGPARVPGVQLRGPVGRQPGGGVAPHPGGRLRGRRAVERAAPDGPARARIAAPPAAHPGAGADGQRRGRHDLPGEGVAVPDGRPARQPGEGALRPPGRPPHAAAGRQVRPGAAVVRPAPRHAGQNADAMTF